MKKILIIVAIVVVLFGMYSFTSYNSLVTLGVNADTQWKQVEVNYQRRFDLIPNLVESVKGIMKQEKDVFSELADARSRYSGATNANDKAKSAAQVESALGRLLVITENYPQLKSSDSVATLMSQLEGTENRISVERLRYNDAIKAYNLKVKTLPSSILASMFGFEERSYFEASAGSQIAPTVKLQ